MMKLLRILIDLICYTAPRFLVGMLLVFLVFFFGGKIWFSTQYQNYLTQTLSTGAIGEWFSLADFNPLLLNASVEKFDEISVKNINDESENQQLWKNFQIKNVQLSLPVFDPYYSFSFSPFFLPTKNNDKYPNHDLTAFSFKFLDPSNRFLLSLVMLPERPFVFSTRKQKIFNIPLIKSYLSDKKSTDIFQDLFSFEFKNEIKDFNFNEPLYYLYLLTLRHQYFPKNVSSFYFDSLHNRGVVIVENENIKLKNIFYFYLFKKKISILAMSYIKQDEEAFKLVKHYKNKIQLVPQTVILRDFSYKEYQSLSFKEKYSAYGIASLFSAWSHEPSNSLLFAKLVSNQERKILENDELVQELNDFYRHRQIKSSIEKRPKKLSSSLVQLNEFYQFGLKVFNGRLNYDLKLAEKLLSDKDLLSLKIKKEYQLQLEKERFSTAP